MKNAKLKAIMDIISQMEDMEMERLMPKEKMDMEEIKPEKKGLTIVKLESDKKPMMEEDEGEEEDDEEEIDPSSVLGRLQAKIKMKKGM